MDALRLKTCRWYADRWLDITNPALTSHAAQHDRADATPLRDTSRDASHVHHDGIGILSGASVRIVLDASLAAAIDPLHYEVTIRSPHLVLSRRGPGAFEVSRRGDQLIRWPTLFRYHITGRRKDLL